MEFINVAIMIKVGDTYLKMGKLDDAANYYKLAKQALKSEHPQYRDKILNGLKELEKK
jgi:hypothetical protein